MVTTISRGGWESEAMIWLSRSSLLSCSGGRRGASASSGVVGESMEMEAEALAAAAAAFAAEE